ncbi:MAG: DNA gyrase/topoisomerase IV subunit A [Bacteroidales bacterium]|nr:DNA gyrase/topoisomerase IV subunit A [Bacteroidales bacterium]
MSTPDIDNDLEVEEPLDGSESSESNKYDKLIVDGEKRYKLTGMYKEWFLDYASYVILERAVPHIDDGLKPVQRRILHAMKKLDDGRYNKVANIIGSTMQYHPHGDASIGDALVQLGQKDLLVDCQGNWGNILTGDSAAAPRYIEARLSKFANEVLFNPKTTVWMRSYDDRNQEPVNLPVKFPLLLAQGVEGIAVGLASKILPHNFNELIDASIAYLTNKEFTIYPDFPTGGLIDCSKYNQGLRGGAVKVRARITKLDKKTLVINEIPFGQTTSKLIESILKANDKGKIKIRKVDDNTAAGAEIVVHLHNDISPDKTIDALYAFTDCEMSISPNSCVIKDKHPHFLGVDEILKHNTEITKSLLKLELEIRLGELEDSWHYTSLEKIFFEQRVYRLLEEKAKSWEEQLDTVEVELKKYQSQLKKEIVHDDILRLVEKPVRKISTFDIKQLEDAIKRIEEEEKEVQHNLDHLVDFTIQYFSQLKKKYGARYPRKTEICSFETIEATRVVVANAKLYANKAEGFVGMDLKRDDNAEYICECSDIDDVIVFLKSGKYMVTKISEKAFVGKDIIHIGIFTRNDDRCIYNAVYRNGKGGETFVKRFAVTGVTRDKEYDLTQGKEGSQVIWFTANPNGEAEVLKVFLKPRPKLKKLVFDYDMSNLAIKNRASMGNILTKNSVYKIQLKSKGVSQFGGQSIWFDNDINRLNVDSRGIFLGEFNPGDRILAICKNGEYYTTNFDLSNRYQGDIHTVEKLDIHKTYTAVYFDSEQNCFYIKRFCFEPSDNVVTWFINDAQGSYLHSLSADTYPQIEISFEGKHSKRANEIVDAEEFIGCKSLRAKGKRLTNFEVGQITFIEPLVKESSSDIIAASGEEGDNLDNVDNDSIDDSNDIDIDGEENFTEDLPTLF